MEINLKLLKLLSWMTSFETGIISVETMKKFVPNIANINTYFDTWGKDF